jgi:lysozyme
MDLSQLSTEQIESMLASMPAAVPAVAPSQAAPNMNPNLYNAAGTIASIGQGLSGGFLDEIAAGAVTPLDVLGGLFSGNNVSFADAYSKNLAQNRAGLEQFRQDAPVTSIGSEIGGAILSPINKLKLLAGGGKVAQAAATGGLQGAIFGAGNAEGNENIASSTAMGAGLGAGAGGGIQALGSMLQGAGSYATGLARGTKNRLYGLGANDIKKSMTKGAVGSVKDGVSGIEQSLDDLIKSGSVKAGSATDNMLGLQSQLDDLGAQTKQIFASVDNVQVDPIQPKWQATTKYIKDQVADADKAKAIRVFNKYKDGVEQNNLLLSDFEHQKSLFQKMGKDAMGPEGKETLQANIFKFMGADLKNAVDDELAKPLYTQTLGKDAVAAVKGFRKAKQDRLALLPAYTAGSSREAVNSFNDLLINVFKTTGGFGVPAVVGGITGLAAGDSGNVLGGALAGLGAGAALRTNTGQQAIIQLLKGVAGASGAVGAGASASALPASRVLADMLTQSSGGEVVGESATAPQSAAGFDLSTLSDDDLMRMLEQAPTEAPATEGFERTSFIPEEMPEMTLTSDSGIDFIKKHEGLRLTTYKDTAGHDTIGYGRTKNIPKTGKITKEEAEQMLIEDIEAHEQEVRDAVKVPLTQKQFDALSSFTFNVGGPALRRSALLKKLNAGDYEGAADEFVKWNKERIKGKLQPNRGLTKRRQAERELFLSGIGKDLITV